MSIAACAKPDRYEIRSKDRRMRNARSIWRDTTMSDRIEGENELVCRNELMKR